MDNYIDKMINDKLENISNKKGNDIGYVARVQDYIVEIKNLDNVFYFERIDISDKAFGYVTNIKRNSVVVALLKINKSIVPGDEAYATHKQYKASVSPSLIGRIIDIFGYDKIVEKKFADLMEIDVETDVIPIMDRGKVQRPFLTGIAGIDLIYPIGKGQRQLIIGDKKTGKTQLCLDAIVNQKDKNVKCIYIAIGKTKKEVKEIYSELLKRGAMQYTTILSAFNDELPPVLSITPYVGLSIAENFLKDACDVFVVIDDLKRHAEAYREFSLISGKTPGRDAYPADIFFTHSRLLEKGCQHINGGSITILPIVETKGGDITDYISTNIISITDGQIVMSTKDFLKGQKPAINYGLSVSRLGGTVQEEEIKKIGSKTRMKLLNYLETKDVYELANEDEMGPEHREKMKQGALILENLKQYKYSPVSLNDIINKFKFIDIDLSINLDEDENDVIINSEAPDLVNAEDLKAISENEEVSIDEGDTTDNEIAEEKNDEGDITDNVNVEDIINEVDNINNETEEIES